VAARALEIVTPGRAELEIAADVDSFLRQAGVFEAGIRDDRRIRPE
jgi:hypothetical protein